MRQNHWTMSYRSLWPTFIIRSVIASHCLIIPKNNGCWRNSSRYKAKWLDHKIYRLVIVTYIYFEVKRLHQTDLLSQNMMFINSTVFNKYIRQNHYIMKYRPLWPIYTLRSKVTSHWLIPKYGVHPSNSLQDKIDGLRNIGHADLFFFEVKGWSHWLTIQKYDIHPSVFSI